MEEVKFYTVDTLAERLAVSERTIRRMIKRGQVRAYQFGSALRIAPDDVEKFLQSVALPIEEIEDAP